MAAASTTSNPLNDFIGAAGAAVSVVNSAHSVESSPTSSSSSTSSSPPTTAAPTPAAASSSHAAAAAHHGLSEGAKIGIIVGCIVGALLLLGLLGLCCCCLVRRRRRSKRRTAVTPVEDEEFKSWKSPINPGRHYSNYSAAQKGQVPTEPTVPLMAAAAAEHHVHNEKAPSLSHHPAMRPPENPFVPEPPSPRRTAPNSRAGLTDGMVPGAAAYVVPEKQRLRKSSSRSRSSSETRTQNDGLPNHHDANRPPTPFGLTGFGEPAGHTIHTDASPPYSAIGQPYEERHVQNLQVDAPSRDLRHSLHNREVVSGAAFTDDKHPKYRNSRGYSTPPEVPSRSPHRDNRASVLQDSSQDSELSTTTTSNSSGERLQSQIEPYDLYQPAQRESIPPWEQHQRRFSNSPQSSPRVAAPPPIPWEDSEYNISARKHQSHSPRQSGQYPSGDGRRRSSRSPATSINGQPRRLRFEDLQADNRASHSGMGQHQSYDGYDHNNRWSQGVGEAL